MATVYGKNAITSFSIHPKTTLGPVHLSVLDLSGAVDFYQRVIGLRLLRRSDNCVWLGVEEAFPLVVLTEQPHGRPGSQRTTGLYHLAILLPSRLDLARSLQHFLASAYPLQGMSDHLVSEALYLSDPEGNGIEIYADRPRDTWRTQDGQLEMATVALNINDLLKELEQDTAPWTGLPPKTRIGHVHLHVADLDRTEAFYQDLLGFDMVLRYGPSASFVSAGGYHHHVGMNTWAGVGAQPPPPDAVGMRYFTVYLPDEAALKELCAHLDDADVPFVEQDGGKLLRDPSKNGILLRSAP